MKIFIRIMGLALVLTLLCTSIAFAAPAKLADIEGLPELPDVDAIPTMKTKVVGDTQTLTLSAPLGWLCAVRNWEWIPVTFDAEGLNGTVEIDPTLQIGYAKGNWGAGSWDSKYWGYDKYAWVGNDDDYDEKIQAAKDEILDSGFNLDEEFYAFFVDDGHTTRYYSPEYFEVSAVDGNEYGTTYRVIPKYDIWQYYIGTYTCRNEFDGFTLAYDGETKDGVHVMYDNYGKLGVIMVPCGNTNFLGTEEEPTKTEVYFEKATAGYGKTTTYWVLRCIKQTYAADENGKEPATTVWYSYNGNYEKTTEE